MIRRTAFALALIASSSASSRDWQAHFDARAGAIHAHASLLGFGHVLLLGDSNTEGFWWNAVGRCRIVNAGLGGARFSDAAKLADWLATMTRPAVAHIMLGTNNATAAEDAEEGHLRAIVAAFQKWGSKVVLWKIPPTSPKFAAAKARERVNEMVQKVATETGAVVESQWAAELVASEAFIADGVHLSPGSQIKRLARIEEINRALRARCP